jgi:hypothetical protein
MSSFHEKPKCKWVITFAVPGSPFVRVNKRVSLRRSEHLEECLGIKDKLMEEEMRHH